VLSASVACAKRVRHPCPEGRFLLAAPLIGQPAMLLAGGQLSIGALCPPVTAIVKGSKRKTRVKALWPSLCNGIEGTAKLTAKIVHGCTTLKGRFKQPAASEKFSGTRSRCGDGVLDAKVGEQCEALADCPGGATSCESCLCIGPSTTTSTSSTTSTTLFSGALAPDYVMFTGLETGSQFEPATLLGCAVVESPVRTGRYACQITQNLFVELRPTFSLEAVYVRVYHRLDVTTPPSAEAFAPVMVTDINPQGITAVDVGVSPGGTIRYRLRDRLNGIDLGFSESMPVGQWVEIELFTAIGDGDGQAELRLNGVPIVKVTGQHFGTTLMDTIFLSNNPNQYAGANGGAWTATFDDIAVTVNNFPGAGRVIARQGRAGAPTHGQWTVVGAPDVSQAWSQTPSAAAARAETPAAGDPLAQTMLVAGFDTGIHPIAPANTIKACQTWARFGLTGATEDRAYAFRRRVAGIDTDTAVAGLLSGPKLRSDALDGAFWRATLGELNAAEIGAVKSGGAGGTGLSVEDAWLMCEYQ
jgi:hypothetical protein